MRIAFKTVNGHYLTAASGGGIGGANDVPFHTDAATSGPWEQFTLVPVDPAKNQYALRTASGNYLTVVNGGGIGGPDDATCPIHADATVASNDERFYVTGPLGSQVAIRTYNGNYLTAINGGGWTEAANHHPVHTDASAIGPWETLTLVELAKDPAACAAWATSLHALEVELQQLMQNVPVPPTPSWKATVTGINARIDALRTRIELDCT